jgi:hypothetical protein
MTIEIRRVFKYTTESFLDATPIDLLAEDNKVAEYVGFTPYILSIQGLSFNKVDGLTFHADADGYSDVVRIDNLISAKGLDYEESVKFPVTQVATMRITSTAPVTRYQWRHKVTVFKPTVALKLQLGQQLTTQEVAIADKYGLPQALKVSTPKPFDIYSGIEEWRTAATKLSASGTVLRVAVPRGKKVILTGISATRPTSPASAYLNVKRDDTDKTLYLDLYCLPSLSYDAPVRIISLSKLEVALDAVAAGTYYVRLTYGIGKLTLVEKAMWAPDELTETERREAEEKEIFEKIEAGVAYE